VPLDKREIGLEPVFSCKLKDRYWPNSEQNNTEKQA
jgi:hypothetical protein